MSATSKLRWRRYLNEMRYTHEEKQLVKAILKEAAPMFEEWCAKFCAQKNVDFEALQHRHVQTLTAARESDTIQSAQTHPKLDSNENTALVVHKSSPQKRLSSDKEEEYPKQLSDYQMTQDEKEIHEVFSKLFKKVAMIVHPDKLGSSLTKEEREEKLKMFKESKQSLEDRNYFTLLDTAEKLNIRLPKNYSQQIRWMKKQLNLWRQSLDKDKMTYHYLFYECETDEQKNALVQELLQMMFGPQLFNN